MHDNAPSIVRYASGGTAITLKLLRSGLSTTTSCPVYVNPTAAAASAALSLYHKRLVPSVALSATVPAGGELDVHLNLYQDIPTLLYGPASFLIFTYAATTAPSWLWAMSFIDVPVGLLN